MLNKDFPSPHYLAYKPIFSNLCRKWVIANSFRSYTTRSLTFSSDIFVLVQQKLTFIGGTHLQMQKNRMVYHPIRVPKLHSSTDFHQLIIPKDWTNMLSKISFSVRPKSPIQSKIPSKFRISVQRYLTSFNVSTKFMLYNQHVFTYRPTAQVYTGDI